MKEKINISTINRNKLIGFNEPHPLRKIYETNFLMKNASAWRFFSMHTRKHIEISVS